MSVSQKAGVLQESSGIPWTSVSTSGYVEAMEPAVSSCTGFQDFLDSRQSSGTQLDVSNPSSFAQPLGHACAQGPWLRRFNRPRINPQGTSTGLSYPAATASPAPDVGQLVQMIDRLKAHDDPKYGNSGFVKYVEEVARVELEKQMEAPQDRPTHAGKTVRDWLLESEYFAGIDDDDQAIACIRKALEMNPLDKDALLAGAVSAFNRQDIEMSLECIHLWLDSAQPRMPHDLETWRSQLYGLVVQTPENLQALHIRGLLECLAFDHLAASQSFAKALLHDQSYSNWNRLGACLANAGRSEDALKCYDAALSLQPGYPRGWVNLAVAHGNLKYYQDALKFFLMALRIGNPPTIWVYLSNLSASAEFSVLSGEPNVQNFPENPRLRDAIADQDLDLCLQLIPEANQPFPSPFEVDLETQRKFLQELLHNLEALRV